MCAEFHWFYFCLLYYRQGGNWPQGPPGGGPRRRMGGYGGGGGKLAVSFLILARILNMTSHQRVENWVLHHCTRLL